MKLMAFVVLMVGCVIAVELTAIVAKLSDIDLELMLLSNHVQELAAARP